MPSPAAAPSGGPEDKSAPSAEITVGPGGITVDHRGRHIRVFGADHDDSFDEVTKKAPWIAGLVFFAVGLIFITPLLIVIAVIWYKMRRARMLNETMLRLAEKGVVPPPAAIEALAANRADVAEHAIATGAPIAEQIRLASRRTAWSDLRKGIVLLAVGLGLARTSAIGLAAAVLLAIWLDLKARFEESLLAERHPAYADYRRRTRRFIPGIY
jgi:protein-S-isoprenylcysteine O-methyltransferase Ste14